MLIKTEENTKKVSKRLILIFLRVMIDVLVIMEIKMIAISNTQSCNDIMTEKKLYNFWKLF